MTSIYLIRHGQTEFNRKGKLPGWLPGIQLNEHGRAQAAQVAELLQPTRFEAVYSSPLERAVETASAIASPQGKQVEIREGLGEVRVGRWEGLSLKSLRRRKLWQAIRFAPSLARFPEGESFVEAQTRIVTELERLRSEHKGAIACVSHADPIKLAIAYYIGLPLDQFQRLTIEPASVSVIAVEDHFARLVRMNDARTVGTAPAG